MVKHSEEQEHAPLLFEVSWEVCRQAGGIYTVLRSKAPTMIREWDDRYTLIGPWDPVQSPAEFEETPAPSLLRKAAAVLESLGYRVRHGRWLVSGRPRVILLDPAETGPQRAEIEYFFWEHHRIGLLEADSLAHEAVAFGHLVSRFLAAVAAETGPGRVIAHFHEWQGGAAIPELRRQQIPVALVFTTHATLLGRYLAMHDPWFYDHVPFVDWHSEARRFRLEAQVLIERAAAHGAHVFTTVSEITAFECEHLIGRKPDLVLPNGLNIQRFAAVHEFQNLHRLYKERIHQFVMGHFFPAYSFDLDQTLYFFTSGRYEFVNKGFDLTLEAMARLNARLAESRTAKTVVFFIITRRPTRSADPAALQQQAGLQEIRRTCEAIQAQVGERLVMAAAEGRNPRLDDLVEDYWRLRLRRMMLAWKSGRLPPVVTHVLEGERDDILDRVHALGLLNRPEERVKIVYHPDFISSTSPFLGMDYDQFVRGCHLGLFPSFYEPWGYAPLEAMALGVPAVTSDVAGFGSYLQHHFSPNRRRGLKIVQRRNRSFGEAVRELADFCYEFTTLSRRERIALRNEVESESLHFDWSNLGRHYGEAHTLARERAFGPGVT